MVHELSVVIPVLNEEVALGALLGDLAAQRDLFLEVVVADGGSRDGTRAAFAEAARGFPFPLNWVDAPLGRGRQMNAGVRVSSAPDLLFLHADSRLEDPTLLRRAKDFLDAERTRRGHDRVAGHFGIRFEDLSSRAGYYYEAKSRLSHPDCVNGDQGQWLSRNLLETLGGFDEALPFLEDARLSREVAQQGAWVALPGRLVTSARRFRAEGLFRRQTINALIRNFDALGRDSFFRGALALYREQKDAERLALGPFLALAHGETRASWFSTWGETGRYVRGNAWQLAFALDCRRNFQAGFYPGDGPTPTAERFQGPFDRLTDNGPGRAAAAVLTMMAFYALWAYVAVFERGEHR